MYSGGAFALAEVRTQVVVLPEKHMNPPQLALVVANPTEGLLYLVKEQSTAGTGDQWTDASALSDFPSFKGKVVDAVTLTGDDSQLHLVARVGANFQYARFDFGARKWTSLTNIFTEPNAIGQHGHYIHQSGNHEVMVPLSEGGFTARLQDTGTGEWLPAAAPRSTDTYQAVCILEDPFSGSMSLDMVALSGGAGGHLYQFFRPSWSTSYQPRMRVY